MQKFNVIHIFSYGETQLIGEEINHKVSSSNLQNLAPVVQAIEAARPVGKSVEPYSIIHVLDSEIRATHDHHEANYSIAREQFSEELLESLADEIIADFQAQQETPE